MQKAIEHQEMMLRNNLKLIATLQKEVESYHNREADRLSQSENHESHTSKVEVNNLKAYIESLHETLNVQVKENEFLSNELNKVNRLVLQNADKFAVYDNVEFHSKFGMPGYTELRVSISGLALTTGNVFEEVNFKLVNKSGLLGVEIRDVDNSASIVQFDEEIQDEYGKYLLVLFSEGSLSYNSHKHRLSSSDLLLIKTVFDTACAALLSIDSSFAFDISGDEIREWKKLCAVNYGLLNLPASYNSVAISEYYSVEGYEHFSISLRGLYIKGRWLENFDFKVATVGHNNFDSDMITELLRIELRDQSTGLVPLSVWPPLGQDEFGYKFLADIPLNQNSLFFETDEFLNDNDKDFLRGVVIALPKIFQQCMDELPGEVDKIRWLHTLEVAEKIALS